MIREPQNFPCVCVSSLFSHCIPHLAARWCLKCGDPNTRTIKLLLNLAMSPAISLQKFYLKILEWWEWNLGEWTRRILRLRQRK